MLEIYTGGTRTNIMSQKKYFRDQEEMHTGDCAFRLSGVKYLSLTLSSVLLNLIPHSTFQNPHKEEIIYK